MSEARAIGPAMPTNRMLKIHRISVRGCGLSHISLHDSYAIGFVWDAVVPKSIDTGAKSPVFEALAINLLLMSLFAIQHSVMARKAI